MGLTTTDLIDWLTGLGWDTQQEAGAPILMGPYIPPTPDRIVVITPTAGPGIVLEGAADAGAFQARVRGGQNNQADAEQLAGLLDTLILNAPFPVVVPSGTVLIHAHRLGSGPSPLSADPDDAERFDYVTQYLAVASI